MPFYHIWTIGCQMNRAESERLASALSARGYQPSTAEKADLVIANTCVVRGHAEQKVLNKLQNLKALKKRRTGLKLAVTGCFVGGDASALKERFPFVDYFFAAGIVPDWVSLSRPLFIEKPGISIYVPIIQGCNNFCSYCIVPYRRGIEHSRPLDEIVAEVKALTEHGAREVTLLGQNVDSYGRDLEGKPDLAQLLGELNSVDGLARIRFLTNHPKDMSSRLIEAIGSLEKVCESINLPVQAGDDRLLKAMRRGYTVQQYRELVLHIRNRVPGIAITTDVIVGFPGETEEEFSNTACLLTELRFDAVHVAAYSPREETAASRLTDDISPQAKKERLAIIERQQEKIATSINARMLGCTEELLVEGRQKGKWQGRTRSDKLVFFTGGERLEGRLVQVKIEKTGPWSLQGTLCGTEKL
jgi:tRNA-2-methylthio-N6-dimethylallyladenosine synthase